MNRFDSKNTRALILSLLWVVSLSFAMPHAKVFASDPCGKILSLLEEEPIRVAQPFVRHQYPESEPIGRVISKLGDLKEQRDGYHIAIVDNRGNFFESERLVPKPGTDTHLVTHSNLEALMLKTNPEAKMAAALEYYVLNGKIYFINDKSGRFRFKEDKLRLAIERAKELGFPISEYTHTESVASVYSAGKKPINDAGHFEVGRRISIYNRLRTNPKSEDLIATYEGIFNYLGRFKNFQEIDKPGALDLTRLQAIMVGAGKEIDWESPFAWLLSIHSASIGEGVEYGVFKHALNGKIDNSKILEETHKALIELTKTESGMKLDEINVIFPADRMARIANPDQYRESISGARPSLRKLFSEVKAEGKDPMQSAIVSKTSEATNLEPRRRLEMLVEHVQSLENPKDRTDFLIKVMNGLPYEFAYHDKKADAVYNFTFHLPKESVERIWNVPKDFKLYTGDEAKITNGIEYVHERIDLTNFKPFGMDAKTRERARLHLLLYDLPEFLEEMAFDLGVLGIDPKKDPLHPIKDFLISEKLNLSKVQSYYDQGGVAPRVLRELASETGAFSKNSSLGRLKQEAIQCFR